MKKWFEPSVARYMFALFLVLSAWQGMAAEYGTASAEETAILKGRVSDLEGRAVEGARIFVYGSPVVRGPADFISAGTDKEGMFRMIVSPGKYWVVARLKKTEGYGPLLPGDKHSGEAVEVEIASRSEVTMDFIVADLKEAIKIKTKSRERPFKISGRIIDEQGSPVTNAYAFANMHEKVEGIPDYLSSWVDDEGRYTLYVPTGRYYIGGAATFPPDQTYFIKGQMIIDGDRSDLDIIKKAGDIK